ncbi:TRAFs-binding domain-containing protein [uncultured Rhodoblastus sp.]|uniref:TRAFs-binding domain-containing protein n=1 Tax=uncultured Rhodoblastus sp. TaxID=543037 RepID=UPI0025D56C58|nr:TRAFs-binding domain-containing protein [uncultured Rhodoblastus sp.]
MSDQDADQEEIVARAREALKKLAGMIDKPDLDAFRELVEQLRNKRQYELMGQLAEAISRRDPKDAKNRRLYAQYLIEMGKPTAAIDVLTPLARRLPPEHPEHAEAFGLLGRAYKLIFFDAANKSAGYARDALKNAVASYRRPFEEDPARNSWHGVNLLALLVRMRRLGIRGAPDLQPQALATRLIHDLQATAVENRNDWFLATLAEASLGLDDWISTESYLRDCLVAPTTHDFHVASMLRQFTEVWDIEAQGERGKALVGALRARLLQLSGGRLDVTPDDLRRMRDQPKPDARSLEALLGEHGPQTWRWWRTGQDRAQSVAMIRHRMGNAKGTGFLVRAGELGVRPEDAHPDEILLLTNFHVVNANGAIGLKPEDAVAVFELQPDHREYEVESIVWSSEIERHDASLLRLKGGVGQLPPMPLAPELPRIEKNALVYIIGHPAGRSLSFSFQNNELLDHEGPQDGKPQIPGVWRVHYRAPTEPGSSGSPVFDADSWKVIALHHSGKKADMPKLNGVADVYAANEGIAIQSIRKAIREATPA